MHWFDHEESNNHGQRQQSRSPTEPHGADTPTTPEARLCCNRSPCTNAEFDRKRDGNAWLASQLCERARWCGRGVRGHLRCEAWPLGRGSRRYKKTAARQPHRAQGDWGPNKKSRDGRSSLSGFWCAMLGLALTASGANNIKRNHEIVG